MNMFLYKIFRKMEDEEEFDYDYKCEGVSSSWVDENWELLDKVFREKDDLLRQVGRTAGNLLEQYIALTNFVVFLMEKQLLFQEKGETFARWFEIMISPQDEIDERKGMLVRAEKEILEKINECKYMVKVSE